MRISEIEAPQKSLQQIHQQWIQVSKADGDTSTAVYNKALEFSPLKVINPLKENKKKFKKNKMFLRDTKDPNWLYIYVKFSMSGVNSTKSLKKACL